MGRKDISHIRKPEILKHAYRVVAREGFIGATINKIAKEMGMNPGTLMHYFNNKEELTLALVEYMTERSLEAYWKTYDQYDTPPERMIETVIDVHFDREIQSLVRGSVFWSCYALGIRNPKIMAGIRKMYYEFFANLLKYLEDANAVGRIKIKDPEVMAYVMMSTIDGLGWLRMTLGEEKLPKLREAYQFAKQQIKAMLGLSPEEKPPVQYTVTDDVAFPELKIDGTTEEDLSITAPSEAGEIKRIIDLRLPAPPGREQVAQQIRGVFSDPKAHGLANYQRIFGPKWAEQLGMSVEELQAKMSELPEDDLHEMLLELAEPLSMSPETLLQQMDESHVEWGMVFSDDNEKTAELIATYPDRFKGMALIDPQGDNPARKTEIAVKEQGFSSIYVSPFHFHITADDPKFYPVYAKALELDTPVFIYSTMNYNKAVRMDIGHPRYVDRVAIAFPDLQIIASLGGWPWVNEMVGVARRHSNVYVDTSFHRPKHMAKPDSGWGMLLQFGNTLLQDQLLFGSGVGDMGLPLSTVIEEMKGLPMKDSVKQKWLYDNAAALFGKK